MSKKYRIKLLKSTEYEIWDRLIATAPAGNVFSSAAWLNAVARLFDREVRIWGVYRSGELVAGAGLVSFTMAPMIRAAGFLPLTPYSSIVIQPRKTDTEAKIASYRLAILDLLAKTLEREADVTNIMNHPALIDVRPFCWRGWRSKVRYTYWIDISDPGRLWERVYNDIRTQVRSCRRKGVKVERSTDAEVLYQLYRQTYEKQGRRVYISQASFCELCDVLEGQKRLVMYVARMGGHAVSGLGVVKDYRGVAHEWVAGTDPDYLQLGVAPFVLWTAIEDLSEEGFHRLDLDGANVPSIARFKSQLGGELTPYYELMNQSLKAKIFDWGWRQAQEWGIADWLKQRWL